MRIWRAVGLVAACALVSSAAMALGSHWAFALFGKLPHIPQDAPDAYAQWIDRGDHGLEAGREFKRFENAYKSAMMAGSPSMAQIRAAATMANQAGGGQNMSPAQAMALAQKMQTTMGIQSAGYTGVVSPHDQRLLEGINPYPQIGDLDRRLGILQGQWLKLLRQWENENGALGNEESNDLARIPSCNDEAGSPNDIAIRAVLYRYEGQKIALATSYIGKLTPIIVQYGIDVKPEVTYADTAYSKWTQIQNPGLRASVKSGAYAVIRKAFTDIGNVAAMTKQMSEKAAGIVAEHKMTEHRYANAAGCP